MLTGILCLVMSIMSMGVSAFYSFKWFIDQGMPVLIAAPIAFTCVCFTNIIFEYAVNAFKIKDSWSKKKKASKRGTYAYKVSRSRELKTAFKGWRIFLAWAFLAGFSMYCTIGGQYDQLMTEEKKETIEPDKDYSSIIILKKNNLKELETERDLITTRLTSIDSVEDSWKYKNTIKKLETRLDVLREKIELKSLELEDLLLKQSSKDFKDELGISKRGFFVYISEIIKGKLSPALVQFYSSLFPSIVIDLISPVCLAIFIGEWRKRKQKLA